MKLVTEYLAIIERQKPSQKPSVTFDLCDSIDEFKRLLQNKLNAVVVVEDKHIRYKDELECAYEVKTGLVDGKDQRFFQIALTFDGQEQDIETYAKLLKLIRRVIYAASGAQPETLWDDVSFYYSQKAYPLINQVENLMRKLITYFMFTKVGKEWVKKAAPKAFQEAIDNSKRKDAYNVLHQVDFKDLADFLFKKYPTSNADHLLYEEINSAHQPEDLDLEKLRQYVPKSNWERYFSDIVSCEDQQLEKNWSELYDLRCEVAHNALVTASDYSKIETLVSRVQKHLRQAIDDLDKVHVPDEEKEQAAENLARPLGPLPGAGRGPTPGRGPRRAFLSQEL